jgi:phage-related protein
MAKTAELHIDILASADKAISAFNDLKTKSTGSMDLVKGAALGAGVAIVGEFTEAAKAATAHQEQVAKVEQAYRNLNLPVGDVGKAMEEIDASARKTGLSADDSVEAYSRLVAATHDSGKAMEELSTAQDLAAFKGISVTDAAKALTSAQAGNTRALKEMGIATKDAEGKQLSTEEVMKKLTEAVHGQADAYGQTAAGQMARFHESLDQMQVTIGNALLPAIQGMLNLIQPLFDWLSKNTDVTKILLPIIVGLGGAIAGVTVAVKVWTTAQAALDAVMDANPIVLVVLAIAGLVAGVVLAYQHFAPFRDAVQWVWDALKGLGDFIGAHWKLIIDLLLGPLGILLTNFDKVTAAIKTVIDWLGKVKQAASDAFGWLGKVAGGVGGALSHIPGLGGLSAPAPAGTVAYVAVYVQPGDDFAEAVYRGLREYQRRHRRPELAPFLS